jgi:hypothetical protein
VKNCLRGEKYQNRSYNNCVGRCELNPKFREDLENTYMEVPFRYKRFQLLMLCFTEYGKNSSLIHSNSETIDSVPNISVFKWN